MENIVLFCKSYKNDVLRARSLAESIQKFNKENIPFYISVPEADMELFRDKLAGLNYILLKDEDILASNPRHPLQLMQELSGGIMQQIIKSEFWRLGLCKNYLMIDSDAYFINEFGVSDFMYDDETPFTVINEAKELIAFAARKGMKKIKPFFIPGLDVVEKYFQRPRKTFVFGPIPTVCSAKVWQALNDKFLEPQNMSFADMLKIIASEMFWYGEALLKYEPIRLIPIEPLFKVFHYKEQYEESILLGETDSVLAETYLGIIKQSNWDISQDLFPRKKRTWKTLWLKKR